MVLVLCLMLDSSDNLFLLAPNKDGNHQTKTITPPPSRCMRSSLWILVVMAAVLPVHTAFSPVLLIPGDGGSQLEAKAHNKPSTAHFFCEKTFDWSQLWLSLPSLAPGAIDCWADNIQLDFDEEMGTYSNATGVQVRVPGFGNTTTVEHLSPSLPSKSGYMDQLTAFLVAKAGLVRGTTVRAAPYDFRLHPRSAQPYAAAVAVLVEELFAAAGSRPVTLISHSMGCLYALHFLAGQPAAWKATHIKGWIPISGPFSGTAKMFRLMASGDSQGIPFVSALSIRAEQRSYESNVWLMPAAGAAGGWGDGPIVTTPNQNFTVQQQPDLYTAVGFSAGPFMAHFIENKTIELLSPTTVGVPATCMFGTGTDTPVRFDYGEGQFPDKQPSDGTVNAQSLEICSRFTSDVRRFAGVDHTGMLNAAAVHGAILVFLG
jgi:pimeloyl-ACP methyl ester carboxylesterase